jgi:hypothetical protein
MAIEIDEPELEAKIRRLAQQLNVSPEEAVYIAVRGALVAEGMITPDQVPARMPA